VLPGKAASRPRRKCAEPLLRYCREGVVGSVSVNGAAVATIIVNGYILLPAGRLDAGADTGSFGRAGKFGRIAGAARPDSGATCRYLDDYLRRGL
jgi:hypothetical protein